MSPDDPLEGEVARTTPIGGAIEVDRVIVSEEEEEGGRKLEK